MRLWKSSLCLRARTAFQELTPVSIHSEKRSRRQLYLASAILFACATFAAQAQQYTSIVVFGDSLSDTGNLADLTQQKYNVRLPGPAYDYTDGRLTDGPDTFPAARKYFGVWVEQLAGMLPTRPAVKASLDGGKDYAYAFATTGGGTGVYTIGDNGAYVTVNNVGQQITDYLATHPKINSNTLFVVWAGAIDVLYATSPESIVDAAVKQAGNVQRLIQAGATRIIVPNLPPLGDVPRLNGSAAMAATGTEGSILFNDTLSASLDIVEVLEFWKGAHIYRLNVFSLFQKVLASPSTFYLSNVTASSQGLLTANPDTYLFWDDLHPTTHGHDILALAALKLVDPAQCFVESGPWMQPSCEAVP